MKLYAVFIVGSLALGLSACFSQSDSKSPNVVQPAGQKSSFRPQSIPEAKPDVDKSLAGLVKLFAQADSIHREAWWVLSAERRSIGKTPFGKIQRALLSSQNIKLSNKSMFRCDRYLVQRQDANASSFPQVIVILEKCSERQPAKKMAQVQILNERKIEVIFFPENLEEVLGLGPAVVNKVILCTLKSTENSNLTYLSCQNWAQDRTREQMIRLDTYEYERDGRNLIKLRGKVFENLVDTRKIVADVPLEGKIEVLETELYPVPEEPAPPPLKMMPAQSVPVPLPSPQQQLEQAGSDFSAPPTSADVTPLPPVTDQVIDPDVLRQQQRLQQEQSEAGDLVIPPPRSESGGIPNGR